MTWSKVKQGGKMPLGEWQRITPLSTVKGINHRKSDAVTFARSVFRLHEGGGSFGLLVDPEPTNEYDPYALKIIGWGAGADRHIGYVDAIEAARSAERFPGVQFAAEFYSLYLGSGGYIDVRFFLSVPKGTEPRASSRVRGLFEYTKDELTVLSYAARADNKLGRFESDILNRYAHERANDLRISLVEQDVIDIRRWLKHHDPSAEEVEAAIHRLVDEPSFSPSHLWELVEIVMAIDGKISKVEMQVADEISKSIEEAMTTRLDGA